MKWIVLLLMIFSCLKVISQCDSLLITKEVDRIDRLNDIDNRLLSLSMFIDDLVDNQCYDDAIRFQIKKIELINDYHLDSIQYVNLLVLDSLFEVCSIDKTIKIRNSNLIKYLEVWIDYNDKIGFHSSTIGKYEFLKSNFLFEGNQIPDQVIPHLEKSFRKIGEEYYIIKEFGIAIEYLWNAVELSDQIESKMSRLSRGSVNRGYITYIYLDINEVPYSRQIFYEHLRMASTLYKLDSEAVDHLMTAYERLVRLHLLENNLDSAAYYIDLLEPLESKYTKWNFESAVFKIRILIKQGRIGEARRKLDSLYYKIEHKNNTTKIIDYDENLILANLLIDVGQVEDVKDLLDFLKRKNEINREMDKSDVLNYFLGQNNYLLILMTELRLGKNLDYEFLSKTMYDVYEIIDAGIKNSISQEAKLKFALQSSEFAELFLVLLTNSDYASDDDIFNAIEFSKAAALFKSWTKNQLNTNDNEDGLLFEEQLSERELTNLRDELNSSDDAPRNAKLEVTLNKSVVALDSIINLVKVLHPTYYKMKYNWSIPYLSEVQASLSNDEVLLNYFEGEEILYAMVIANDYSHTIKIDSLSILKDSIEHNWKNIPHEKHWSNNLSTTSNFLYRKIISPIQSYLKDRLIISPSGSLFQVPFDALDTSSDSDDFHFLIYDHAISYVPSCSFFYELRNSKENNVIDQGLLIAPKFSSHRPSKLQIAMRSELYPLKYNVLEAQAISKYFDNQLLINEDATKDSTYALMSKMDIIHLATHAKSNMDSPEKSYVAFYKSGENMKDTDYKWYQDEMSKKNLSAKMIVLSACETSLGQIYKGEGAMSLANSCFYAGAHSVVASLWSAADYTSFEIITSFYAYLNQGLSKDKAIQKAQIDYLENNSGTMINPFYWAGFSVMGNTNALKFKKTHNYRKWVLFTIGIGFFLLFFYQIKLFWQK